MMMNDIYIYISLKITMLTNAVAYYLYKLPAIKNVFKNNLYDNITMKIISFVLSGIFSLGKIIFGKVLYLYFLIFLPLIFFNNLTDETIIQVFIVLSIVGGIINTIMFNPTTDKYYSILLLKMDAKKYVLIDYSFFIIKLFVGYIGSIYILERFFIISYFNGRDYIVFPLLFFLITFLIKNLFNAFKLYYYNKKQFIRNENTITFFNWIFVVIFILIAYGSIYFNYVISVEIVIFIMLMLVLLNVRAIFIVVDFIYYKDIIKIIFFEGINGINFKDQQKILMQKQYSDNITFENVSSKKRGYAYFNEIFIKRHSNILVKSIKKISLCLLIIGCFLIYMLVANNLLDEVINYTINNALPGFLIIMFYLNKGGIMTNVLFINSDNSMLTYNFFKTKKSITNLFVLRVKSLTLINLVPAVILALFLAILLYLSGGTFSNLNYILLILSILSMSVFFTIHYLILYYLFQPFTKDLKMKNPIYYVITSLTYFICYYFMTYEISIEKFSLIVVSFTLIYLLIGIILTHKISYKTFKNK